MNLFLFDKLTDVILSSQISDIRELQYEKMGIGSSYLFRIDDGHVVSMHCSILKNFNVGSFIYVAFLIQVWDQLSDLSDILLSLFTLCWY